MKQNTFLGCSLRIGSIAADSYSGSPHNCICGQTAAERIHEVDPTQTTRIRQTLTTGGRNPVPRRP